MAAFEVQGQGLGVMVKSPTRKRIAGMCTLKGAGLYSHAPQPLGDRFSQIGKSA